MHGRIVALKKVRTPMRVLLAESRTHSSLTSQYLSLPSENEAKQRRAAIALHLSLHHPTIVSLLSIFGPPSAHYHVLEYCSRGTLHGFLRSRDPPLLTEPEMRSVLKSLAGSLVYLRKERVLHRDINPSNIYIHDDFRVVSTRLCFLERAP